MDIKILLVEDDPGLSMSLRDRLEASGYNVNCLYSGHRAEEEILDGDYSLVILDIMLKGKNGFDICQAVRTKGNMTPVIMLTARGQLNDKVKGLKLGADDYMTKPFEIAELFARMEALLRRSNVPSYNHTGVNVFKNIQIDFQALEVKKDGLKIDLSAKEFQLLRYLFIHQGRAISREELLNEIWGYDENTTTRTIDTHVGWLRQKLEDTPKNPSLIITVHGFGYKLNGESED